MVDQFPGAIFSHEDVGGDQKGIVHVLVADNVGYISVHAGGGRVARDLGRVRTVEDGFPSLHDVVPARKRAPTWVNTGYRRPLGPKVLHGLNVSIVKGYIESLISENNGGIVGHG